MSLEEVVRQYNVQTNFLEHLRVTKNLQNYLGSKEEPIHRPVNPFNLQVLSVDSTGSKKYRVVLTKSITNAHENLECRWNQILDTSSLEWNQIFAICFNTILDNNLIWFQFRIVYRILGTQSKRHKMGQTENGLCRICNSSEETIKHLFVECTYVAQL